MNEDILKLAKECASGHPVSTFLCNRLTARAWSPWLEAFYRAAYNAGLEAAAKRVKAMTCDYCSDAIRKLEMKP